MIFRLDKSYVPESYRDSRDFRVFLKLLGTLVSVIKYNVDTFPSLYSPEDCPDEFLEYLADMVGYKYNDGRSIENNRIIIKYYPYMLRYRGSANGIKLATALSLNTSESRQQAYSLDNIIVEFDFDTATIKIYCPYPELIDKDLLEAVRPVGCTIKLIKSSIGRSNEELDLRAHVKYDEESYDKSKRESVGKSKVGFGNVDMLDKINHNEEGPQI